MTSMHSILTACRDDIGDMCLPDGNCTGQFVQLPHVQLDYIRLTCPEPFEEDAPPKYSAEIILDKLRDAASVQRVEDTVQSLSSQRLALYLAEDPNRSNGYLPWLRSCLYDTSSVRHYPKSRFRPDCLYWTARNRERPILIGANQDYESIRPNTDTSVLLWFYPYDVHDELTGAVRQIGVGSILVAIEQP